MRLPTFVRLAVSLPCLLVAGVTASAQVTGAQTPQEDSQADAAPHLEYAVFAGGCFWCMEHPFDRLDGVVDTTVGYAGGSTQNPTYAEVSSGSTGYAESVRIRFDPQRVSYDRLLEVYWRNVDPLVRDAQFCDHGSQYRSAIFAQNPIQARLARESKQALEASGRFDRPIVTEIVTGASAGNFHPAEAEHQDYAEKNPIRYRFYRYGCGRDARLDELWGDEARAE